MARWFSVAIVLVGMMRPGPSLAATPIFLLDTEERVSNTIFRVDPTTGQLTALGSIPLTFGDPLGLAAASDNLLYVATVGAPAANRLLRVTLDPFTIVELGAIVGFYQGLEYFGGQLYGIDETTDRLSRITPTLPAVETLIGVVRLGSPAGPVLDVAGGDLAVSATGAWYMFSNAVDDLFALDITTAVATQLDPTTFGPLSGLAFDYQAGGVLLGSSGFNDTVARINTATGGTISAVSFCLACPTVYDHRFGDLASPRCTDVDRDGFAPEGDACGPADCDDAVPTTFPGATERCNGRDDDCDAGIDEEPAASAACTTACTATAQCQSGACVTTPVVCNDGNPCTSDACNASTGCQFTNQPDGLSCSDGNVCTGEEVCAGGTCTNAPDLDCNDGNTCTTDGCAPPNGCRNMPVSGCCTTNADCADASQCTQNERCVSGQCISDPVGCDDGNPCTNDSCSPAGGCANIAVVNGISCSDGNICNGQETCQGGGCSPGSTLDCSDGNVCTVDGCNPQSGCTQQPIPACCTTAADCADASACTINERCVNQACVSDPLACNDGNACTSDGCNPASGCTFAAVPNGQSCSNLDFCDGLETCQAGACVGSSPPNCGDGNPCTTDACNGSTGCTHTGVAGCCFTDGDCVDADACTVNERCVGGTCTSDARNCLDGNLCTTDGCDPDGGCTNTPLIDGSSCTDSNMCDGAETCTAGGCLAGQPPNCDDANFCTQDGCVNATGCQHTPIASCCNTNGQCADADQCTINERCTAAHTCASDVRPCVDGNVCTTDVCNPSVGCVFTQTSGPSCNDGNACTAPDACSGGSCVGTPVQCEDGDWCDGRESCDALSGACIEASGALACTPGSGRSDRTCAAEWYVDNPSNAGGAVSNVQVCREGDPSCDRDTSPTTCTFAVALCFNVDDPRLDPPCVPSPVLQYLLRKPTRRADPTAVDALVAVLGALPGATIGGRRGQDVAFAPTLADPACTSRALIVVPLNDRTTIAGRTYVENLLTDADRIKLVCVP